MTRRDSPWKFPLCTATALVLVLAFCFIAPAAWWRALWSPLSVEEAATSTRRAVLVLLPPPEIEVDAAPSAEPEDEPEPPPPAPEPEWWQDAWRGHLLSGGALLVVPDDRPGGVPAVEILRRALPSPTPSVSILAVRDTTGAAGLTKLHLQLAREFSARMPAVRGGVLGRYHRQIANQAATLFDEFLLREIEVTDTPEDRRSDRRERGSGDEDR